MVGARTADFVAIEARSAWARETWALQETPMGSFMFVWFDGEVEKAFANMASDGNEYSTWFRAQVKDVTASTLEFSLKDRPDILIDWHS